jgi:hypothetical protein
LSKRGRLIGKLKRALHKPFSKAVFTNQTRAIVILERARDYLCR